MRPAPALFRLDFFPFVDLQWQRPALIEQLVDAIVNPYKDCQSAERPLPACAVHLTTKSVHNYVFWRCLLLSPTCPQSVPDVPERLPRRFPRRLCPFPPAQVPVGKECSGHRFGAFVFSLKTTMIHSEALGPKIVCASSMSKLHKW